MSYPTLKQIQEVADDHLIIWDDLECDCYRADTKDGWTVDELHGFCHYYGVMHGVTKGQARKDLLDRLEESEVAPCDPDNENCQDNGCFTLCDTEGCEEKAEEFGPRHKRCRAHFTEDYKKWLTAMGYTY